MQKIIIFTGIVILIIGLTYPFLKKIGLGKLPGDIIIKGTNQTMYFPVTTCVLVSIILSVIFKLLR